MDEQQTFRWTDLNPLCLLRRLGRDILLVAAAGLIAAMLTGRVVWGIVRVVLSGVSGEPFTWAAFMAGAFLNAIPGIIIHILLIPIIVLALKKANLMD